MEIIRETDILRNRVETLRKEGKRIGFVPTMGYFHEGHLNLMRMSVSDCDVTIVSNYINPTQFDRQDDLEAYPADIERDRAMAEALDVDIMFYPENLYESDHKTWVNIEKLTDVLCGRSRPGHFRGVATIVCKLFNIVNPHVTYFGQKDAQQAAVIGQMIRDLNYDIQLILSPIIREPDGLAMSSRNVRLTPEHRKKAPVLYEKLQIIDKKILPDLSNKDELIWEAKKTIEAIPGVRVDYIDIRSWPDLEKPDHTSRHLLIAGAMFMGKVRLIDNIIKEL
ncbi:MAG: pantoate--beta-alanine ligase [Candidatus Marinimicrobia bacterium]|jgi:pantoate--beta-alanine ligase|nr:pantoate--beta-alanine ligase [Candidatus Neomarinimicrobiota bacterium]